MYRQIEICLNFLKMTVSQVRTSEVSIDFSWVVVKHHIKDNFLGHYTIMNYKL